MSLPESLFALETAIGPELYKELFQHSVVWWSAIFTLNMNFKFQNMLEQIFQGKGFKQGALNIFL